MVGQAEANLAVASCRPGPRTIKAAENQVKQARRRSNRHDGGSKAPDRGAFARPRRRHHPQPGRYRRAVRAGHLDAARRRGEASALRARERVPRQLRSASMLAVALRRLPDGTDGARQLCRRDPEFTPPVIYSLETRQKLVYLVEARPEGGPIARCSPGRSSMCGSADVAADHERHRRPRPGQALRRQDRRRPCVDEGRRRRDRRLPRPERLGQDDDHPHHVRPADARRGRGHGARLRHPDREPEDQARSRLHDAEILVLRGSDDRRESRIRGAALPAEAGRRACRPHAGGARA